MKVGWIGLGNMGGPMAANLVTAGHQVAGLDLSASAREAAAAAGVRLADSIADTVADADVVITMLPAGRHVEAVMSGPDGVLAHAQPDTLIIDSSTIDIDTARTLHELSASDGFRFLDAPVSGGVSGAKAGSLTFMIGGSDADVTAARPLIEAMAGRIFHAGGPGSGQAAKICNNMMLGINLAGLCEGAVLAGRLGLDARTFFDIASVSSGDSWALRTWFPVEGVVDTAAVNNDFQGGFAIDLMRKDVGLALAAGDGTKTSLPFAQLVVDRLETMHELGWGARDSASLVKLVDGSLELPQSD